MPPRSPDLNPLDYGTFGPCKVELDRGVSRICAWETRVVKFKDLISKAPVKAIVGAFEARLRAVIRAGGGHINAALKEERNE